MSKIRKKKKKDGIFDIFKSRYARGIAKRYVWSYVIGIAILVWIDMAQTDVPLIVGESIDYITLGQFTGELLHTEILRLVIIGAIVFLGRIAWRWFIFGSARKIERDMRNDLYEHLQTLSASYFQEHNAGEIMAIMTSDIEAVRMVFAATVMMGMDAITIGLSTLYKMVTEVDPLLTLITFIPMSLVAVLTTIMGGELMSRFTKRQEAFADLSDFVQEKLGGIKVIKAFVQEKAENKSFEKVNLRTKDANISEAKMEAFMFPFMRLVAGLAMVIAIGYGGYITIIGRITAGNFSSFLMFLSMLVWPMMALGRIISLLTRGSASIKRLEAVLHAEADIADWPEAKDMGPISGSIEARNLTFRYPGESKDVISDMNFKVEKGQTLGIVGRTGSGKTSLVNLLLRIFEPGKDMLYIGGREIHTIPLEQLRRSIGYVPQDSFLFSDTVSANIAFGDRSKTASEIKAAAEAACVHDNIVEFTDGYDTLVGERGVSLSGGQKQRIAIARALLLDPEILILDDSVSAVDTDTEERILEHLHETRAGKTNVIIAHRISTLQSADQIIVIDDGRIAEAGTHQELVDKNGIYADMYRRQLLEKMKKEEFAL